jgi:hypothetical protein
MMLVECSGGDWRFRNGRGGERDNGVGTTDGTPSRAGGVRAVQFDPIRIFIILL